MSVAAAVIRNSRDNPDGIAVRDGMTAFSHRELDERSTRLANALVDELGVSRGDRVAVLLPNCGEIPVALAACAKAGATYCGLNFRMSISEYVDIFDNAEPAALITSTDFEEVTVALRERRPEMAVELVDDGYEQRLAQADPQARACFHEADPESDFAITYTSGTTGRPKGVRFTLGAVVQHATVAAIEYEIDENTRWLVAIPHNSSLHITFLPVMLRGGAVVFMEQRGFDPQRFAEEVRSNRVTHTFLVPTMLFRLLESTVGPEDLATLDTVGYGSAPMPPDRLEALLERFGPRFVQLYGMSEIASIGTMLRKQDHELALDGKPELLRSAGRASYLVDIRVLDEHRDEVPHGERGEIVFGTPYRLSEYHRDPERTAELLVDGWVHSGDIGRWGDDGYLYVVDRKKDLIISGGLNIVPSEIENVLYEHPAVLEAAVFGLPDEEWGERVAAAVALKDGAEVSGEALIEHCRGSGLQTIKVPVSVEVLESLPKNAVGKLAKRELRDRVAAG